MTAVCEFTAPCPTCHTAATWQQTDGPVTRRQLRHPLLAVHPQPRRPRRTLAHPGRENHMTDAWQGITHVRDEHKQLVQLSDEAAAELDRRVTYLARRQCEQQHAAVERVRALHTEGRRGFCAECEFSWPCATAASLGGAE